MVGLHGYVCGGGLARAATGGVACNGRRARCGGRGPTSPTRHPAPLEEQTRQSDGRETRA